MRFLGITTGFILLISFTTMCQGQESLGDAARRMRTEKESRTREQQSEKGTPGKSKNSSAAKPAVDGTAGETIAAVERATPEDYRQAVSSLFAKDEFEKLDAIARYARSHKTRFVGGGWKLYTFYMAMCPRCNRANEPQTEATIDKLKKWMAQNPKSVTARIALAGAYADYAWLARGDSPAEAVNEAAWKPYRERLELADATLEQASQLEEKCPQWYVVRQIVGRGLGWNLARLHESINAAKSFEPTYFYSYQEYAFTLQPKWMGQEGDSERFADQISSLVGGKDGAEVYFKMAADMYCSVCEISARAFGVMSWRHIEEGYSVIQERYGVSDLVMSQMAKLAVQAKDRPIALKLFMEIGDRWSKDVWASESDFQAARSAVMEPPDYIRSAWAESAKKDGPKDKQYQEQVLAQFTRQSAGAIRSCESRVKDDSQKFFIAMRVANNGTARSAMAWPPTRFSQCLMPKLARLTLSAPPADGYWVFFPVNFKPEDLKPEGQH